MNHVVPKINLQIQHQKDECGLTYVEYITVRLLWPSKLPGHDSLFAEAGGVETFDKSIRNSNTKPVPCLFDGYPAYMWWKGPDIHVETDKTKTVVAGTRIMGYSYDRDKDIWGYTFCAAALKERTK